MKILFSKMCCITLVSFFFIAHAFAFPVTVDNCGTPLTFQHVPKRAVINDINMAEMAFALNLEDNIVGFTGIHGD